MTICRPIKERAASAARSTSLNESGIGYPRCDEAELLEDGGIWSSREVLNATCGSSGASGALRVEAEVPELPIEAMVSGVIDGILVL